MLVASSIEIDPAGNARMFGSSSTWPAGHAASAVLAHNTAPANAMHAK
jgi:hypothetical protein